MRRNGGDWVGLQPNVGGNWRARSTRATTTLQPRRHTARIPEQRNVKVQQALSREKAGESGMRRGEKRVRDETRMRWERVGLGGGLRHPKLPPPSLRPLEPLTILPCSGV